MQGERNLELFKNTLEEHKTHPVTYYSIRGRKETGLK